MERSNGSVSKSIRKEEIFLGADNISGDDSPGV